MKPELMARLRAIFHDSSRKLDFKLYDAVKNPSGDLNLLIGHNQNLGHRLLIPFDKRESSRIEISRAIEVSVRELHFERFDEKQFLQVDCKDPSLNHVFESLAIDLVGRMDDNSADSPHRVFLDALSEWKSLFERERFKATRESIVGLVGELVTLRTLAQVNQENALSAWAGPTGHRHDFTSRAADLEVKTTTSTRPHLLAVKELHQFEKIDKTPLFLVRISLVEHPSGESLTDLIDALEGHVGTREDILDRVETTSETWHVGEESRRKYSVVGFSVYPVDESFPSFPGLADGRQLPPGIVDVSYTIDLSTLTPLSTSDFTSLIATMLDSERTAQ